MARYWSDGYKSTEQVGSPAETTVTMVDRVRWDNKQDPLVFDDHPVLGSESPVTSDGIARAMLQLQDFVKQKDVELCYIDVVTQADEAVLRDKTYIDIRDAYNNGKTLILRFVDSDDKCAYFYDFQGNVFRFVMFEVTDVLNMYTYWISPDDLLHTEQYSAPYKRPNPEVLSITYGDTSVKYDGSKHASVNIPKVPAWALGDTKPKYDASEVGAEAKGVAASRVNAHNNSDTAHADIRNLIANVMSMFNTYATTAQLNSVLQTVQGYASAVQTLRQDAVLHTEVVDDMYTNNPHMPLSAKQGMLLRTMYDALKGDMPDMSDYVKNTDYATTVDINNKSSYKNPIVPHYLDYAVMKALTDCKNHEWTDEEKVAVAKLLGSQGAVPNRLVQRYSSGGIAVPGVPTADVHATSKKYVDGLNTKLRAEIEDSAIKTKASGEVVTTTDSAKAKPKNIKLFGKSKQDGIPSMEAPIEVESLGECGSIEGKVLTGNLFGDVSYFESQGFTQNEDYWEGSGDLRLLYTNYKGINGSLIIEYDYMSLASYNVFIMEIHYTDGTTERIGAWKQNEWVHNRIVTNSNKTVDYINRTYVDRGNFYVKNFMISTDGKPYEPYTEQPFTILTPNGLRGIPLGKTIPDAIKNSTIHMNGVYWDSVEQQYYIADTKNEDGKDVQRIIKLVYDGSESWGTYDSAGLEGFYVDKLPFTDYRRHGLCTQFKIKSPTDETGNTGIWLGVHSNLLYAYRNSFYDKSLADKGLANFKAHLNENPLEVYTWLDKPIVTETDVQYDVVMNYPNTTIVNDEGAYMEVEYVADPVLYIEEHYIAKEQHQALADRVLALEQIIVNS